MAVTKSHVLQEIKRIAASNDGKAPGSHRFHGETGIRKSDWYPHLWLRWGDAVAEAGFARNEMAKASDEQSLLEKLALLTRQLQQVPIEGQLTRAAKQDPTFPAPDTFRKCLGSKEDRVSRVIAFCESRPDFQDVLELWRQVKVNRKSTDGESANPKLDTTGYVYLIRHGSRREYRVGCTENVLRRHGEISIELPEKVQPIHVIITDDRFGIEAYWKNRFKAKRLREGADWYALDSTDIAAFKRRKFM